MEVMLKKSLSNKVTHFLCSSDTKSDKSAKSASELGIPIVQQKWLYDAIKKGKSTSKSEIKETTRKRKVQEIIKEESEDSEDSDSSKEESSSSSYEVKKTSSPKKSPKKTPAKTPAKTPIKSTQSTPSQKSPKKSSSPKKIRKEWAVFEFKGASKKKKR